MNIYDPLTAPDPGEWQSMGEDDRIGLVIEHHRRANVKLPNEQVHAVIHVVVENQIALADEEPTEATLVRLMDEGLDRHDGIHAIGHVLVNFVQELLGDDPAPSVKERYNDELMELKATDWLKEFQ